MDFTQKWHDVVKKKNSLLCVSLDPAEHDLREKNTIPEHKNKLEWCLETIQNVSEFCAAIKINRKYVEDFSRDEMLQLTKKIHEHDMLAILDSKIADIGSTNDAALYHTKKEGFDAVTFAPFACNIEEAAQKAKKIELGLIVLVLMSNPEYLKMKNSTINGMKGFEYFSHEVKEHNVDGIVIGAPSEKNHISFDEIKKVKEIVEERLVLMPGIGAQGGDAKKVVALFHDNTIVNVGRAIIYSENQSESAKMYRDMINEMRK